MRVSETLAMLVESPAQAMTATSEEVGTFTKSSTAQRTRPTMPCETCFLPRRETCLQNLPQRRNKKPRTRRVRKHFHVSLTSTSPFVAAYNNGQVPCRIWHGSTQMTLKWSVDPRTALKENPNLLALFFEGLRETAFPFSWIHAMVTILW